MMFECWPRSGSNCIWQGLEQVWKWLYSATRGQVQVLVQVAVRYTTVWQRGSVSNVRVMSGPRMWGYVELSEGSTVVITATLNTVLASVPASVNLCKNDNDNFTKLSLYLSKWTMHTHAYNSVSWSLSQFVKAEPRGNHCRVAHCLTTQLRCANLW